MIDSPSPPTTALLEHRLPLDARFTNMPRSTATGFIAVEQALYESMLPKTTQDLVRLRVSQINGCAFSIDLHTHDAKDAGESDERLFTVAAWREAPWFTPAERAALALAEAATRIADRTEPVPDEVWNAARAEFDDEQLGSLLSCIAVTNAWNRLNVMVRQPAGSHRW